MFENLCTLPLSSELFAQVVHPSEPILAVGLSAGHVETFRLPLAASTDEDSSVLSSGTSTIDTQWRTRRHKGSCRTLTYSYDGDVLYSAGTDGIVKAASSTTGQVSAKALIPPTTTNSADEPTVSHALSPQTLLLTTDSGALHLYDLRTPNGTFPRPDPSLSYRPHEDYISSLTALPPTDASTSGFSKQWVTTGGSTLAVTDLRRGVLVKSDDQDEELLSATFVSGLPARPGRSTGQKLLVGSSNGVLMLWERGIWKDQAERIIVDPGRGGGETLDALAVMPADVGDGGKNVVVGVGDGSIRIVKLGVNKVVGEPLRHDDYEAVVALGFDVGGRMISGGGNVVKVWQEAMDPDEEDEEDEDEDEDEDDSDDESEEDDDLDDVDGSVDATAAAGKLGTESRKRVLRADAAETHDSDSDISDDEAQLKRNKTSKKARDRYAESGIMAFEGME